jgi:hypothetical protein
VAEQAFLRSKPPIAQTPANTVKGDADTLFFIRTELRSNAVIVAAANYYF